MEQLPFDDRLEVLGILAGAVLVLAGLGTIAGTPWETAMGPIPAVLTVLGAVVAIALGVALAWLVRTGPQAA